MSLLSSHEPGKAKENNREAKQTGPIPSDHHIRHRPEEQEYDSERDNYESHGQKCRRIVTTSNIDVADRIRLDPLQRQDKRGRLK